MKALLPLLFATLLSVLPGCGGGTAGTSSTEGFGDKVLKGRIISVSGEPLIGVTVEAPDTGVSIDSDILGEFALSAESVAGQTFLKLSSAGKSIDLLLPGLSAETSVVGVEIELDLQREFASARSLNSNELIISNVGGEGCAGAFAPARVFNVVSGAKPLVLIEQIRKVKRGTVCTVDLRFLQFGNLASGIGYQLLSVIPPNFAGDGMNLASIVETVDDGVTDIEGTGKLSFVLSDITDKSAFLLVEAPTESPVGSQVSIVIDPLNGG